MRFGRVNIEHNRILFYIILALIAVLILVIYFIVNNSDKKIGGDKDSHGCLIVAGYSWNETKQQCVREWEESAKTYCSAESRGVEVCPELYLPVCGNAFEIQPKPENYSSSCIACSNESIIYYTQGACL